MKPSFIQIHYLTSYPCSLLNRDELGFAKRIPFGGANRTRISSQCLKRHWRIHEGRNSLHELGISMSIRSREIFERLIFAELAKEFDEEKARMATEVIFKAITGDVPKSKAQGKKSKKGKGDESVEEQAKLFHTAQLLVMGQMEISYLITIGRELCLNPKKAEGKKFLKELEDNLKSLGNAAMGLDGALFGRMVTNDMLTRVDAAIHVAHAFTVHVEQVESDYFTAVDDFVDQGSAHINATELTSGLYYGYVVVDLQVLRKNLEILLREREDLDSLVIQHLIKLIATVSPGAKRGSTAPYAYAHWMLVEAGDAQPCTFANAFLKPVKDSSDLLKNALKNLEQHISAMDKAYGMDNERAVLTLEETFGSQEMGGIGRLDSIDELARWVGEKLRGG